MQNIDGCIASIKWWHITFIGLPDFILSVVLQFKNGKNQFNFVFISSHMCVWHTNGNIVTAVDFFTTLGFAQLDFIRCAQSHTLCVCVCAVKYFPRITPFHIPIQRRMILRSICWWCTFGWCIWIVFEKEVRRKKRVKYFLRLKWFAGNCTMCSSFKFQPFSPLSQHTHSSNKWENAIKKIVATTLNDTLYNVYWLTYRITFKWFFTTWDYILFSFHSDALAQYKISL